MKRLLIVLVVLGVVLAVLALGLVYADGRVRALAESEAERRLADALPVRGVPTVTIDAFPFVLPVLLDGSVERLRVEMTDLESSGVRVAKVQVTVDHLQLDRDRLLEAQALEITGIERARIEGWVSADDISRLAPASVSIADGRVQVTYRGKTYAGTASVSKHAVYVAVEGMPPIITPLPETDILPCEPSLDVQGDRLHVACEVDALPPAVAAVLAAHGG